MLEKRNMFLEGFLLGCMNPDLSLETVLIVSDALCPMSAISAPKKSIQSQHEESETSPFALIAEMQSRRSSNH